MESKAVGQEEDVTVIAKGESAVAFHKKLMEMAEKAANAKKTRFEVITESPEKLAKFLDKHKIRPCGNEVMCGKECPCFKKCAQGNIPTDYEIWIAWLKKEGKK